MFSELQNLVRPAPEVQIAAKAWGLQQQVSVLKPIDVSWTLTLRNENIIHHIAVDSGQNRFESRLHRRTHGQTLWTRIEVELLEIGKGALTET